MGILLASAVLLLLVLVFAGLERPGLHPCAQDWFTAIMRGATAWGVLLVLISETLGAFSLLTGEASGLVWMGAGLLLLIVPSTRAAVRRGLLGVRANTLQADRVEALILMGVVALATSLLILALFSPPNNVDSLLYHMARVAHWAQSGSLAHYPTAYIHQLVMPYWAELAILQLYLSASSDVLSGVVQWAAMAGSLVAVAALGKAIAGPRSAVFVAVVFAATLPMGILQSTSTQNDYVAAFWGLATAHEISRHSIDRQRWLHYILVGAAAGMGLLTKGTFAVTALPLGVWYVYRGLRDGPSLRQAVGTGLALTVALLLISPFWVRNVRTFGASLSSGDLLGGYLRTWPAEGQDIDGGSPRWSRGLPAQIARLELQMLSRNLTVPVYAASLRIAAVMRALPDVFGEESGDELMEQLWNHEDTAGNPFHLLIALVALPGVVLAWREPRAAAMRPYALVAAASYLLLPVVVSNGASVDGLRFQLGPLLLCAPVVGSGLSRLFRTRILYWLCLMMLAYSLPYVLLNNTRPLIGRTPYPTRVESVFTTPREVLRFAMFPHLREPFKAARDDIDDLGCAKVGIRIDSSDPEYLLWTSLNEPVGVAELENLRPIQATERYRRLGFAPCAIVCTICGDRTRLHGLPLGATYGEVKVFWGGQFNPDEDG